MVDCAPYLPFGGWAQTIEAVPAFGAVKEADNSDHHAMPYVSPKEGANRDQVHVVWQQPVSGSILLRVRIDNPL